MELGNIGYIAGSLLLFLAIWVIYRREKSRRKIRNMQDQEKWQKLSALSEPFGFVYEPKEDIFVSHIYAWQRSSGYEALFDALAPKFNMIFHAYPVYFDYQDKTWLIEFWKGQYGINTGAEAGVYHANRLIPKSQRKLVNYNSVSNNEMPLIGLCLERRQKKLFSRKEYHWWMAAFRMGLFSQPEDLLMYVNIYFDTVAMAQAFAEGLKEAGFSPETYRIRGQRVSVVLEDGEEFTGIKKLHRSVVQSVNRCYCGLYRLVTMPFTTTADRMLFLYEQLPWCFRHMLRLHAFGKKHK